MTGIRVFLLQLTSFGYPEGVVGRDRGKGGGEGRWSDIAGCRDHHGRRLPLPVVVAAMDVDGHAWQSSGSIAHMKIIVWVGKIK